MAKGISLHMGLNKVDPTTMMAGTAPLLHVKQMQRT